MGETNKKTKDKEQSSKLVFLRVWERISDHNVLGRAAQLSYYFLLALFPLLIFLVTLLGYFASAGSQLRDSLISYLGSVMPYSALMLVHSTLDEVTASRGGGKLSFSLLAALWVASSGMGAISDTLNSAYNVKETRPWWKVRLISVALTIGLAVLILTALVIVLYGGRAGDLVANWVGLGSAFTTGWQMLQWPTMLAFVYLTFHLIYFFAPNRPRTRWHWLSWGTLAALILWLMISFGLRIYLHFFNSYSLTYGSLGALIVLMLWFYLTGVAVLVGGEVNSELEDN
ncbi:MAG TPA: YihY/virulence factor BrkB family protein [Pyrinomonadaceae bacterium]|nr:YihY/virulence factor BrkB family protein [Pyrinomonadaceae bacterium]